MDTSSNQIWINADNFDDFEMSRPKLFRDDMRELYFKYLGITLSSTVLDGGCATGVLTRFIARGLSDGIVTGFDISKNFVEYGNKKITEENLCSKAKIILDDGYNLSFGDNTFDAVVNHTYLGVLSDPIGGLKELIRVCKTGGTVSASCPRGGASWKGDYKFDGFDRLCELSERQNEVHNKVTPAYLKSIHQDEYWHFMRYPKMFAECGLTDIAIYFAGTAFLYNDNYWSDEYKIKLLTRGIEREIEFCESRKENPEYAENGFPNEDFDELISLLKRKRDYLLNNLQADDSWEWEGYTNCIISGKKITP